MVERKEYCRIINCCVFNQILNGQQVLINDSAEETKIGKLTLFSHSVATFILAEKKSVSLNNQNSPNPAVPRISFATRFARIFAHIFATGNIFQKYFSARRNNFDLTQNSVKAVLTVSNLIMMRTYVFR